MTDQVNVRALVLDVLLAVTRDGVHVNKALQGTLEKYQYLGKQERSFLTRVSLGTLEQMILLDHILNQYSKVPVNKMKPVIRNIMRSAVYQMKFMDSVPVSAACNEAVKLAGKRGFGTLKSFVNGVLRTIGRNLEEIPLPDPGKDLVGWLSVTYSMPQWILELWLKEYSADQVEEMLQAFLIPAPTCIRVNTARISREQLMTQLEQEGAEAVPHPQLEDGLYLKGYDYLAALPSFQQGLFYIQDASSMQVAPRLGIKPGDLVLDVCGAPGGKSIHMAELLAGTGMVEARDLTPQKVELLNENILRSQLTNIRAVQADAAWLNPEDVERADVVLADLPCSGLGVIGRKADIKYNMSLKQTQELAVLQRQILEVVCQYVKPGGILLYSTCTINPGENQENVAWLQKTHPEFELDFQEQLLPKAGEQDGFFLARFTKQKTGA